MSRILLIILLILLWGPPFQARAFLGFGKGYLVRINGKAYTPEDFKKWWNYWHDKNTPVTDALDDFIAWNLLADEAESMNLADSPHYRRKLEVFLKVRSLLLLRNEEVDQKIHATREKLWDLYLREFVPRVRLRVFYSENATEARTWAEKARQEGCQKVFEKIPRKKKRDLGYRRPRQIPPFLRKDVVSAASGAVLGPYQRGKRFVVVCVEDRVGPTPGDFRDMLPDLGDLFRREEEARLTRDLIERLKKKYRVEIAWDTINKITPEGKLPDDLKDRVVIRIADKELSARDFQELLKRDRALRYPERKKLSEEDLRRLRKIVVNNIVAETLTDLEALNRHYERREPLKSLWEFYKRQMLVREFERQVIWPKVKVTEEDIREYYEEHKQDYLRPGKVVIAVIQSGDEKLMRELYRRIRSGEDFFEVAKRLYFHGVHPQTYREDQVRPEIKKVLDTLEPGDISPLFKVDKDYFIIKLIDRIPPSPHPFKMVKDSIKSILERERFEELRRDYVERLKLRSRIEINEKAWQKLLKELGT
ncbi:peptidyl-prolyl cis-trans isomerase [Thermosulfurimonas sp. F29]|uniref:peptidylprolyl isomerase n=1 Tax=Thermosulfurimonas sp. F29 TaxID=2867247 RepID=UPI001C82E79A|nr:peptidylprolyl isomerase [Thermosulfurimonas sp. F29]MBX6422059.1 peptidyl-prolyl cis-trans isomerase [Thermosulfurimonas sp. F29]